MRILPYFNAQPQVQKASLRAQAARTAAAGQAPAEAFSLPDEPERVAQTQAAKGQDRFIPASPVTGVVYSLSSEARSRLEAAAAAAPEDRTAGVVKSGQYGFYRLDGRLGGANPAVKGEKLDLLS
ncbi:hypothetical protein LLH00_12860 [bacterium]|nr:hypothetical protein [bacterium]